MTYCKILLLTGLSCFFLTSHGQQGVVYDLKKPEKYENRTLASEKSGDKGNISKGRRFVQNTITHYNFYFNAHEKLIAILTRAKAQFKDDYSRLLPFYNYSLDGTASQKTDLDSIIYKSTTGILVHDTRNDWIDNLYMLIGQAFYYRKDFDSAFITFQFTNYAFAPREKDGYEKPIGSNANADEGSNAFTVSTPEKRNTIQKIFSLPPSRNESLIWKVKTYLAKNDFPGAAGLIEILAHDPQFPPRLAPDLSEVRALFFYKQAIYDSAAFYLEKALPLAQGHEEKARWEYLIAQLYELERDPFQARTFYERVIRHTYNPIMEIYARLNAIRQNKFSDKGEDLIRTNIEALVKMARKDRYEPYRDIIYYTAAQMELERNNKPGAKFFLQQSIRTSQSIGPQKNKSFLQLANLYFDDKQYKNAKNCYDSVNTGDREIASLGDLSWLPERKANLTMLVSQLLILERQDSLQRIAALPPDQRDAYIKKLVKTLRKQQGLKEEEQPEGAGFSQGNSGNANIPDLFSAGQVTGTGAGDWYFNNPSLKSKGFSDFKTRWGNRPNVDNWMLSSMVSQQALMSPTDRAPAANLDINGKIAAKTREISFKALMDNLPLTPEKVKKMSDSVENAWHILGKTYQEGISDYTSAITADSTLLEKFPETKFREQTLFNLYYCYKKIGDEGNASRILALMRQGYPNSHLTAMIMNPDSTVTADGSLKVNATRQYDKAYLSFIEGRFDEALEEKRIADSLYGDKFWTPQLLYIESVYFIHTNQDNKAKEILGNIQMKFINTPMAAKAANLLDVLNRRKQIEDYLAHLQIKRASDDDSLLVSNDRPAAKKPAPSDSAQIAKEDTSQLARARIRAANAAGAKPGQKSGISGPEKIQVDPANLQQIQMDADQLARVKKQYDSLEAAIQKARADSIALMHSRKMNDSLRRSALAALKQRNDSVRAALEQLKSDSVQLVNRIRSLNSAFAFTPDKPHAVLIVMEKVDPVYVSEARNAFNRYNQENYYSAQLTIDNASLNDSVKVVVINQFDSASGALDYLQKAKALSPRQIIAWMPANKYYFLIISRQNLERLLSDKDLPAYRKFLSAAYPGKF